MKGIKRIVVKHIIGAQPEGMASDWMTEKDWKEWHEYVDKCKKNGSYGKETETIFLFKSHPIFPINDGIILDLSKIEKHEFKPMI